MYHQGDVGKAAPVPIPMMSKPRSESISSIEATSAESYERPTQVRPRKFSESLARVPSFDEERIVKGELSF